MRHILIIVGEELHINEPFLSYILGRFKGQFSQSPLIYYIGDGDKELPFKIENKAKSYDFVTIVANESNFYTISKILCTLSGDSLELKDETLMPSRTEIFTQNSFVMQLFNAQINLLKAVPTQKLPNFLLSDESKTAIFSLLGIDKSTADTLLAPLNDTYNISVFTTSILENLVFVKAVNQKFGQIESFLAHMQDNYPKNFINDANIVKFIVSCLERKNLTLSFSESCTAGLVASKIGQIPGASNVFSGSLVTYSNHIKNVWLGVDDEIFKNFGAVSNECVLAMANGAREMAGSDFGVGISGIAGPGGATETKPVGRVYIAVCDENRSVAKEYTFSGNRNYIREQAAISAYALLLSTFWDEIVF